jgi:uncharacterized protein
MPTHRVFKRLSAIVVALAAAAAATPLSAAVAHIAVQHPAPVRAPAAKHMLFKIRGPKGATIYLLGSVHLLTPEAGKLPPVVDSAFADSKRLVFETSLDSVQMRAAELLPKARLTGGATLRTTLSPAAVPKVDSVLHLYNLSIDQLNGFKPWFVSLVMAQLVMQRAGFAPQYGVDLQLNARAKEANKPVSGLESVDFQMNLFDMLDRDAQETMLANAKGPDESAKDMAKLKDAWLAGDVAGLEALTLDAHDQSASMVETVLTKRNRSWIPQIETMLGGSDNTLVVVGAAHLIGKEGVLALLRAKGYTVEQM